MKNKMANEYLGECHALCFIENRKGISQMYPKIEEFVQLVIFLAKLSYLFCFKEVICENVILS